MGVKSTVELSRAQAEEKFVSLTLEVFTKNWQQMLKVHAVCMSAQELEDEIERLDDKLAGGESFRNYLIVEQA